MGPKQLSVEARSFCGSLGAKDRFLARYRPFICPFHVLMEYVPQDCSVLDIGCGAGLWLFLLLRSGRISRGVGFDIRADKIELANSITNDDDKLEFVHVGREEKWPGGSFDCATIIDVLHHIPTARQSEFFGRVRQTGAKRVIFKDIDPKARFKSFMNTVHDAVLSRQIPRYCPRDEAVEQFEKAGYRIVENFRCDMLWYSHYLIVAERD